MHTIQMKCSRCGGTLFLERNRDFFLILFFLILFFFPDSVFLN